MEIKNLLKWSTPKNGQCEATPTGEFWAAWRSDKQLLRDMGVSVKPGPNGTWVARWAPPYVAKAGGPPARVERVEKPEVALADITGDKKWSLEQKDIFGWFAAGSGNLVVTARAGTGKTTTIKAAFDLAPEATMLYAVFNKKNQKEARLKITNPRVETKTLHSLGYAYILRVWTNAKPDEAVEHDRIISLCGKDIPDEVAGAIARLVGFAKNATISPSIDDLIDIANDRDIECIGFEDEAAGGWTVNKLAECSLAVMDLSKTRDDHGRISFNDMVWLPVAMNWVRPWFDLVCIDEAQDMNMPQLAMAIQACKPGGRVCVVGDDRQAIYGFRGAVSDSMNWMARELEAERLPLTITYRCPSSIVELAKAYVPDYRAAPGCQVGTIETIKSDDIFNVAKLGDVILSRANAPLMPICLGLLRKGVRARIEGRDVGRMLLAIVKSLKARSVPDFLRRVESWAKKMTKRAEGRKNATAKIEQINDQAMTLSYVAEGLASMGEVEQRLLSLFQDSDNAAVPCVLLSSVHKAKGLEWNRVFLVRHTFLKGRGVRPSSGSMPVHSLEEENIYYVAVTRSRSYLAFIVDPPKIELKSSDEPAKN